MLNREFVENSSRTRSLLASELFSLEQLVTPLQMNIETEEGNDKFPRDIVKSMCTTKYGTGMTRE